jgi:Zn-dependent M28 family amino/carboxypeptidase
LRIVFFANEEAPHFGSDAMGSLRYARELVGSGERVLAMLSLETIGYYTDRPGSQHHPFPLGFFYPDRGDFLAFVANLRSRALLHRTLAAFRATTQFPSEGVAAPPSIPGVSWSDHWSFWQAGVPALMITDTAPYRYPHYHSAADTPDRVDYERLARIASGLERTLRALDARL